MTAEYAHHDDRLAKMSDRRYKKWFRSSKRVQLMFDWCGTGIWHPETDSSIPLDYLPVSRRLRADIKKWQKDGDSGQFNEDWSDVIYPPEVDTDFHRRVIELAERVSRELPGWYVEARA